MIEACYECHDEDSDDPGDMEAIERSAQLYRMIGESELAFAQTAGRVAEVGRGVLLIHALVLHQQKSIIASVPL